MDQVYSIENETQLVLSTKSIRNFSVSVAHRPDKKSVEDSAVVE